MKGRHNFNFSALFDPSKVTNNPWSQDAGDQLPVRLETRPESIHGHDGGAAAPRGQRVGRRQAERRFKERAEGRRKPSGTSGTSNKHEKHADIHSRISSSVWPSKPHEEGLLDGQAQDADFKEVLKKVECDWARVQKREDRARSQRATNSLSLRALTRWVMNVVYNKDPDYVFKDEDWRTFEGDVDFLAGYWGVSVSALRQLHRRGQQQARFTQAAHNRPPYDQARGALFSSTDAQTVKALKAIFKDLHSRRPESVLQD